MVLWAVLVEIDVVDTHSPFIVLFLYKNGIRYPLWMDYFFNESSREKFCDLPFNGLMLIVGKPSQALLFGRSLRVYIQSMLDELPRHPWHIGWFPCEYVSVSPKKADEREFLFITQARADDSSLR
jgi:hypothetical protein